MVKITLINPPKEQKKDVNIKELAGGFDFDPNELINKMTDESIQEKPN